MTLKIAIDAGHGPNTPGKRSPDGMREYWFNSAVANAMKAELEKYEGVSVLFTHEDGRDVPLTERTNKANRWGADVLVSIHANAFEGIMGGHGGIDTFVYGTSGHSYKIAQIVQRNLIAATELRDRGVKVANFHMLRETEMPAILIEHGFMDSTTDLPYLKSDDYRKLCGEINAKSIAEYYGLKKKEAKVMAEGYKLNDSDKKVIDELKALGITDGKNPERQVNQLYLWHVVYGVVQAVRSGKI
jgi:N-acetylmuramoyl-L-alanine amidase